MADATPNRADYRLIKKIMSASLGGKVEYVPAEFDRITVVFAKAGGSWQRLFQGGSPQDLSLLKEIIKVAFKKGYVTKKYQWGGEEVEGDS